MIMFKMFKKCIQKVGFGKLILLLVLVVVLLQLFHIFLLSQLESDMTKAKTVHKTDTLLASLIELIHSAHVLDSSGSYHVVRNIIKPKKRKPTRLASLNDVTIATQSTSNHLGNLIELSDRWQGPVSVCVLTYDTDFPSAITAMLYLYICHPSITDHVTFHLAYPTDRPPNYTEISKLFEKEILCDAPLHNLRGFHKGTTHINYNTAGIQYPHNLLRNIAVSAISTSYVFLIDIDMVPSVSLRKNFVDFINRKPQEYDLTAYVVPAFEVKLSFKAPENKSQLNLGIESGHVRPFYWEVCWSCQRLTGFDEWRNLPEKEVIEASYEIEWEHPWEPFYIAKKISMPPYDERFKQYGFNRVSQICEMFVSGYRFFVLNNDFLVHKGYKFPDKFHKNKTIEHRTNKLLYKKFQDELKTRYPESTRTCS